MPARGHRHRCRDRCGPPSHVVRIRSSVGGRLRGRRPWPTRRPADRCDRHPRRGRPRRSPRRAGRRRGAAVAADPSRRDGVGQLAPPDGHPGRGGGLPAPPVVDHLRGPHAGRAPRPVPLPRLRPAHGAGRRLPPGQRPADGVLPDRLPGDPRRLVQGRPAHAAARPLGGQRHGPQPHLQHRDDRAGRRARPAPGRRLGRRGRGRHRGAVPQPDLPLGHPAHRDDVQLRVRPGPARAVLAALVRTDPDLAAPGRCSACCSGWRSRSARRPWWSCRWCSSRSGGSAGGAAASSGSRS